MLVCVTFTNCMQVSLISIYLFRFILDLDLEHFDHLTQQIWASTYVLPKVSY